MGGWARHEDAVYLVSWDAAGIVKIGTSCRQRWRRFTLRGARLITVLPLGAAAYDLELAAHMEASGRWPRSFAAASDAVPYLGAGGGGWKECYLASPADASALLEHVLEHVPKSCLSNAPGAYATDGRTYGLTKKHVQAG